MKVEKETYITIKMNNGETDVIRNFLGKQSQKTMKELGICTEDAQFLVNLYDQLDEILNTKKEEL